MDFDPRVLTIAVTVDSLVVTTTGTVGFVLPNGNRRNVYEYVRWCICMFGACVAHVWRMFGARFAVSVNRAKFCPAVATQTRNFCS